MDLHVEPSSPHAVWFPMLVELNCYSTDFFMSAFCNAVYRNEWEGCFMKLYCKVHSSSFKTSTLHIAQVLRSLTFHNHLLGHLVHKTHATLYRPMKCLLSISDWMYHAPAKAQSKPVGAPPPSQITCLSSGEIPPPDMPPKMLIKETDSAYIRLAKKGGREDLLRMRSPKAVPTEPVGYPRVDWYYHEDIVNDQAKDTQE